MTPFDPSFALDTLLPIVTGAYQFSWGQTIVLPEGWEVAAEIKSAGKPSDPTWSDCWGLTVRKGDQAVMAIRGTETGSQWFEDFEADPQPCVYGSWFMHAGFRAVWETISDSVLRAAGAVGTAKTLFITGHSLGAALALIAGMALKNQNTWTFAGPRVFAAGTHFDCYRITNRWDLVPHVPVPPLYAHVGWPIEIDGGLTFDPRVAHSLDKSYVPGLKKLIK